MKLGRLKIGVALVCVARTALPHVPVRADVAAAEALFRDGRRLLDEGNLEAACAKLAESQIQDPSSGTLLNLALCHERQGKVATAWAEYLAAGRLALAQGKKDRADVALKKSDELEPRVPRLTIQLQQSVPDLLIVRGTERVSPAALDTAVPIDPGPYAIVASAPGRASFTTSITLGEGESKVVIIPALLASAAPDIGGGLDRGTRQAESASPRKTAAFAVGGVGLATVAVGTFFGVRALSEYSRAEAACPTHRDCSTNALDASRNADASAWIANVGLGVGLVAVGVGAYLFFSSPSRTAAPTAGNSHLRWITGAPR